MEKFKKLKLLSMMVASLMVSSQALALSESTTSAANEWKSWQTGQSDPVNQGKPLGNGIFYPEVGVALQYDDNVYNLEFDTQSSTTLTVSPRLRWEFEDENTALTLATEATYIKQSVNSNDNTLDLSALAELSVFATEFATVWGGVEVGKGEDARGARNTINQGVLTFQNTNPNEWNEWTVKAGIHYGLDAVGSPGFDLEVAHTDKEYTNNRVSTAANDYAVNRINAEANYKIRPSTTLKAGVAYSDYDYDIIGGQGRDIDSNEVNYYLGIDWEATNQTEGYATIGRTSKDVADPAVADGSGATWEAGVRWSPVSYSNVVLSTASSFVEQGEFSAYTEEKEVRLSWNHRWYSFLDSTLILNKGKADYVLTGATDKLWDVEARANYRMRPGLQFGAGFRHSERNSNRAANLDYVQNVFELSVDLALH